MLVAIGILIILLLIIVIYYQALIAEKVKVEDAEMALKAHLSHKFNIEESNIISEMAVWEKDGMRLDKESYLLLERYAYFLEIYNNKVKKFPYSLFSEVFLKKKK
jgi:hypothetical protein